MATDRASWFLYVFMAVGCGLGGSSAPMSSESRDQPAAGSEAASEPPPGSMASSPPAPPMEEAEADDGRGHYGGDVAEAEGYAAEASSVPAQAPQGQPMATTDEARSSGGAVNAPSRGRDDPGGPLAPAAQSWRSARGAPRFATVSLGGGQQLSLRKVRVSVAVEGMRARTVIDHIFYNPHDRVVEGTFRYALPPESSVSSYAMFLGAGEATPDFFGPRSDALDQANGVLVPVEQLIEVGPGPEWGELRVGRIVPAERGREVYETVTRRRIDPALVEEVAPNTFEAKVFPIRARGYNRVIVSYEQQLPSVAGELEYLFPLPQGDLESFDFTLGARGDQISSARGTSSLGDLGARRAGGHHWFHKSLRGPSRGGTFAFRFSPVKQGPLEVLAGTHPEHPEHHFVVRLEADARVAAGSAAYAERAVFLLDTSLSEHPDRFRIDVALLRGILERSPGIRQFNVITFDAGARWLSPGFLSNTAEARAETITRLEGILLEGATDLSAALRLLARAEAPRASAVDVFLLTDGALSWGERDPSTLIDGFARDARFDTRVFAYRTGLGAENADLMRRLTTKGAVFNCLSTDSVPACATAHHRPGLRIENVALEGDLDARDLVLAGGKATLTPGSDVVLAGRLVRPGRGTLRIEGKLGGERRTLSYPIELTPRGELASRAWAEIAVAHLLSSNDDDLEGLAVALGQHYRVPSRLTSFLVLETDQEYELYDLAAKRRAAGGLPIAELVQRASASRPHGRTSWERFVGLLRRSTDHNRLASVDGGRVLSALTGFGAREPVDFLPGRLEIPAVLSERVPADYREHRPRSVDDYARYQREATRRKQGERLGAAVRALSSVVENDPMGAESSRLVGRTLEAWGARAEAADLLFGVLERRPYEPQSYRDLANVLWLDRPSMTTMLFEALLAGQWDARFRGVDTVVREEYALFARAFRRRSPTAPLARFLEGREQALGLAVPAADLRVTITWNTDNTDVDLWVTDPAGEKCYYGQRRIASGGELLDDVTEGFGPERFQATRAVPGTYLVEAHYYGNNGNRLVAETHVTATVASRVGTDAEKIERVNLTLSQVNDVVTIGRFQLR